MTHDEWVTTLAAQMQVSLGPLAWADIDDIPAIAATGVAALEPPRNHAETLLLRSLLAEAAAKYGANIHRRAHFHGTVERCAFTSAPFIESLWTEATDDPRSDFVRWATAFVPAFRRRHPRTAADRAAQILRTRYAEPWTARLLAKTLAVGHSTLTRQFASAYGMSMHEYHRIARVAAALDQLADNSVEAVAAVVGFRNRKNLYTALGRTVALTPTAFRSIKPPIAREIVEQLRIRLDNDRRRNRHS